jgi:hypothetical protein
MNIVILHLGENNNPWMYDSDEHFLPPPSFWGLVVPSIGVVKTHRNPIVFLKVTIFSSFQLHIGIINEGL